jgi:hypothetical protein
MRQLILVTLLGLLALSSAGCASRNGCRESGGGHFSHFGKFFNRGDRCDDCPPADCAPGIPQATMMYPSGPPQVLPGPIEIAPVN